MGILRIYNPADDNSVGVVVGHIIRAYASGTSTIIGEYAPVQASPITNGFQNYDVSIPDGTYDIEFINPNLVDSSIIPRIYFYQASTNYSIVELATGVTSLTSGKSQKWSITVGSDVIYVDSTNRRFSTTVKAKVAGSGTKRFGSSDGTAKTLDGVTIAVGSSYFPIVEFQDVSTSVALGVTLPNTSVYTQFAYYLAPATDGTAPTSIYIPVNNATGAYVRIDTNPTKGTLSSLNPQTGTVTYTPTAGQTGTDSFNYSIISSNGTVLSSATETVTITAQGQTATPIFSERAYGLADTVKITASNGVRGGTGYLYNSGGTLLQSLVDSSGNGYVIFTGLSFTNLQQIKATWKEANKTESIATALITVYAKPTATAKTISTNFNQPITINVLNGDTNIANMPNF